MRLRVRDEKETGENVRVGVGVSLVSSVRALTRIGGVRYNGKMAYVPQEVWLVSGTIRDNVVFGAPFDQKRLDDVYKARSLLFMELSLGWALTVAFVQACLLDADLSKLRGGDSHEVLERGANLSGGQKQRIALARYSDSERYCHHTLLYIALNVSYSL